MTSTPDAFADVYSLREVARAADASVRDVRSLVRSGGADSLDGRFLTGRDAVRAVRVLRGSLIPGERELFTPAMAASRSPGRALAASGALHVAALGVLIVLGTLNLASAPGETAPSPTPTRLVFLAIPGPGGGGGGGGLRQPTPPAKSEVKGPSLVRSAVPPPRRLTTRRPEPDVSVPPPPPVRPQPVARPVDPPPPPVAPAAAPQVVAPVATVAADARDRSGTVAASAETESQGPGSGGGAGSGQGTGMGEGSGSGIGPGSGGGTGGGPYRPGSGITPPSVLREVRPDYTEEARRRGIEGDVVLEIVVRADGSVGSARVTQGLGGGLDGRALDAVRQWRFSPAHRYGTAVDVIVEVAVEFKLR
jgi:protein TonB